MMGLTGALLVQYIWQISTCSVCLGPPVSKTSGSSSFSVEVLHSEESVLIVGISWCLGVSFAWRRGVFSPEAGGVLPAELSEDLFSTEQRRLRRPKLPPGPGGAGSDVFGGCRAGSGFCFVGVSVSFCDSEVLAGESDSWKGRYLLRN